jgi:hypothetical protein
MADLFATANREANAILSNNNVERAKKKRKHRGKKKRKTSPTSEADTDSAGSIDKVMKNDPVTANALASIQDCPTCTRLQALLPCCLSRKSSSPCATCAAFETATAAQVPDTQTVRQDQEDRIKALRIETKQFEEQNDRTKAQLDTRKKLLQDKIGQLKDRMGLNAFKKVTRDVRKAGEIVVEGRK